MCGCHLCPGAFSAALLWNKGVKVESCHLSEEAAVRTHFAHLSGEQTIFMSRLGLSLPLPSKPRGSVQSPARFTGLDGGAELCPGDAERALSGWAGGNDCRKSINFSIPSLDF